MKNALPKSCIKLLPSCRQTNNRLARYRSLALLVTFIGLLLPGLTYATGAGLPSLDIDSDWRWYRYVKEDVLEGRTVYQEDINGPIVVRHLDQKGNPRLVRYRAAEQPDKPGTYWLLAEASGDGINIHRYVVMPDTYKVRTEADIRIPIFPKKVPLNYIEEEFLSGTFLTGDWLAYDSDLTNVVRRHGCESQEWILEVIAHGATYSGVFSDRNASERMLGEGCKVFFEKVVLTDDDLNKELVFQSVVQTISGHHQAQNSELINYLRAEGHVPIDRLNGNNWVSKEVDVQRHLTQRVCRPETLQTLFDRGATLSELTEEGQAVDNLVSQQCATLLIQHMPPNASLPRLALYKRILKQHRSSRKDDSLKLLQAWLEKVGPPISSADQRQLLQFAIDKEAHGAVTLLGSAGMELDDIVDDNNNTALHMAVKKGDVVLASALVQGGASILALNIHDESPLELAKTAYEKEAIRISEKKNNHFKVQFYQAWLYPFFISLSEYKYQEYLGLSLKEQHRRRAASEAEIAQNSDELGPDRTISLEKVDELLKLYPFCAECLRARANVFRLSGNCPSSYEDFASARLLLKPDKYSIAREMQALADCGISYKQYNPNTKYVRHWGAHAYIARENTEWAPNIGWLHDIPPEDLEFRRLKREGQNRP